MEQQVKILHTIGFISIFTTIITAITDNTIVFLFLTSESPIAQFAITIHYIALVISLILYLIMISKIGKLIEQKLLLKFGSGLISVIFGVFLLLIGFALADGLSARSTPSTATTILLLAIGLIALFLVFFGAYLVCKIYIVIANYTESIFFRFSWLLIILAVSLFLIFIVLWVLADSSQNIRNMNFIAGVGFGLSYNIAQLFFSIGAFKFSQKNK